MVLAAAPQAAGTILPEARAGVVLPVRASESVVALPVEMVEVGSAASWDGLGQAGFCPRIG